MSKQTYSADVRPSQGISMHDLKIHHGFSGQVKRGDKVVKEGNQYPTKAAALRWATAEASRFRTYRQTHGEGLEDVWARQAATKKAERERFDRLSRKRSQTYELLGLFLSDMELVTEWLPKQAIERMAKARELIAFVETDPTKV